MKNLKQAWIYLSGKKTVIGMLLMLSAEAFRAFAPGLMTPDQIEIISTAGAILGGIGVGHKAAKTQLVAKISQTATHRKKQ